ncbi:hypothetical protein [uncultured Thiodictyon sp.]|uniref:hypothetical protein n=1 Tax=uncultured Thiodictyon sp. TaxID=1846217 RepID=UPI0025E4FCF5|nr:hypothetical protein [uncultured Thiodictyon sp.]
MFTPRSRYWQVPIDAVTTPDGRTVRVVRFAVRAEPPLAGYHRRLDGQRLDHIAAHYLKDPTGFWRLCDANATVCPGALAARDLIAVPATGG